MKFCTLYCWLITRPWVGYPNQEGVPIVKGAQFSTERGNVTA